MKKLFAILAVVVLFSAISNASLFQSGDFQAKFYCVTAVTGPTETSPIDLGNYFIGNTWLAVTASPVTYTFSVAYSDLLPLTVTGSVTTASGTADIKVVWAGTATWAPVTGLSTIGNNAVGTVAANQTGTYGCTNMSVTATATHVKDNVAEAVTYTATLTATAQI